MTTENQILSSKEMFDFYKRKSGIEYMYVPLAEIIRYEDLKKQFKYCLPVPKTHSYHRYVPVNDTTIQCCHISTFDEIKISKLFSFTLKENNIVVCLYRDQWYLGIIEAASIENPNFKVHFH